MCMHLTPPCACIPGTFCWYLDASFCYGFHRWEEADVDVIAIGRMVCGVVFGVALLYVLWLLLLMGHAIVTDDEMQSGAEVQSGAGQGGARFGSVGRRSSGAGASTG